MTNSRSHLRRRNVFIGVVVVALMCRAGLAYFGFDLRPVVTSNDEIYWAEVAWALEHGHGYTMPCCEGTMFAEFYPVHPPVYILILRGMFRYFGFTPSSMRLVSLLAHIVSVALLMALLWRLRRLRFIDDVGLWIGAILALTNFTTLTLSRWGRPDAICTMLAIAGYYLIFAGSMKSNSLRRRTAIVGLLVGLALSTHTISAIYYVVYFLTLVSLRRRLSWAGVFVLAAIPCLVFTIIWWATFGSRFFEALHWHRIIAKQMGGLDKPVLGALSGLVHGDWRGTLQAGSTASLLIMSLTVLIGLRSYRDWRGRRQHTIRVPWLIVGSVAAAVFLLISQLTGLSITRSAIYFPIAVVMISILVSNWPGLARRIVVGLVGLFVAADIAQIGYYTIATHREAAQRSVHRFDPWLDRIAPDAKVAVGPPLWFQTRAHHFSTKLVDLSIPILKDYWLNTPDVFADCDIVIIGENHPLVTHPQLAHSQQHVVPDIGQNLILFVRNPAKYH